MEALMWKKDNLRFGVILGFATPLLCMVIYYFARFYPLFSVADVIDLMRQEKSQITAITIPCLVLNIALFTFYVNTQRDQTAKGLFAATLTYAITAFLLKFFL
jgi:hypothetical protein